MALVEINPGDSVSCSGGRVVTPIDLDLSGLNVAGCVWSAEDGKYFVDKMGPEGAASFAKFYEGQQAFINRCISVQCGSIRSNSGSVASSASSGSASRGSGLTGGRIDRVRALAKLESNKRKKVPDGLCYSKLLKTKGAEAHVQRLGEWPSMASVLRTPASAFQSLDELERFRLTGDEGMAHVAAGGCDGVSFVASASRLASSFKYPRGSFGAVLAADARGLNMSAPAQRYTARTLLGGSGFEGTVSASSIRNYDSATARTYVVTLPSEFWSSSTESCSDAAARVRRATDALCMTVLRSVGGGAYAFVIGVKDAAVKVSEAFGGLTMDVWVGDYSDVLSDDSSVPIRGSDATNLLVLGKVGEGVAFEGSDLDLSTRVGEKVAGGVNAKRVVSLKGEVRCMRMLSG